MLQKLENLVNFAIGNGKCQKRKHHSNSQEITARAVFYISNSASHKKKLLAHAWSKNLLPPILADSLTFSEFVACISRGSFKMPGRTKMIDELYEDVMLKLKDMLKQSSSVSLTKDAAKMSIVDSYVAITGHWISSGWELLSAVMAVSISNV